MMYIVDTDVLVPFSHPDNPNYQIVQDAVQKLKVEGHQLLTTSQNLAEFWNVSTRPTNAKNGLGRTPSETEQFLQELERLFPLMPDSPEMYPEWRQLVVKYEVSRHLRSRCAVSCSDDFL